MDQSLTISDLQRLFSQPRYIIEYAVTTYGPEPERRVGMTRLWSRRSLPAIRRALAITASNSTKAERRPLAATS
jgi:hypothetical protein